jgi:hypothetical protein
MASGVAFSGAHPLLDWTFYWYTVIGRLRLVDRREKSPGSRWPWLVCEEEFGGIL